MKKTDTIDWYFDFISPFAYFQFHALCEARKNRPQLKIRYQPILFAGLLKQHGHKGPAEIPAKRKMTYRHCHWYAIENQIPFRMPAAHPFNPLPFLRLAIAHQCDEVVIAQLFKHIWVMSADDDAFYSIESIAKTEGFCDAATLVTQPAVKQQLIDNTNQAIEKGVFGVPTIAINDQLFWGVDMTTMALNYLANPNAFSDSEYHRINHLPIAGARI